MNFDRMRALLLDQAIRGKLVPQLDSEEAVEQIGEVSANVLFEIPNKWKWVKLNNLLLKHLGGGTPSKSNATFWNGDIPWASVKDLKGTVLSSTQDSITEQGLNNSSSNLIPAGTVIVCTRIGLGKIAINTVPMAINQDLRALFLSEKIDKNYFLYLYSGMKIEGAGTTVKGIKLSELLNLLIPLPPLEEQVRIVAKLDEAFAEIDRAEKAYQELQTLSGVLRGQILQEAIQGKLVPQLDSEEAVEQIGDAPKDVPFAIPEKWKWVTLSELVPNIVDCPHSTPKYSLEETQYLAIDTNCITPVGVIKSWRYVTEEIYKQRISRLEPQKNDIIYTREGSIGRAARLPDGAKVCMGQRVMLIRPGAHLEPSYLQWYLMSHCALSYLTAKQRGIGVKHINVSDVKKLPIPVPSLQEQRRIVDKVRELLESVDALSRK